MAHTQSSCAVKDALEGFACPNPDCGYFNCFGAGNLTVSDWIGKDRAIRRLYCSGCGKRFSERKGTLMQDSKLPQDTVVRIVKCLVHGCSVAATADICEVDPRTVERYVEHAGKRAHDFHQQRLQQMESPLPAVELDELHTRVARPPRKKGGSREDPARETPPPRDGQELGACRHRLGQPFRDRSAVGTADQRGGCRTGRYGCAVRAGCFQAAPLVPRRRSPAVPGSDPASVGAETASSSPHRPGPSQAAASEASPEAAGGRGEESPRWGRESGAGEAPGPVRLEAGRCHSHPGTGDRPDDSHRSCGTAQRHAARPTGPTGAADANALPSQTVAAMVAVAVAGLVQLGASAPFAGRPDPGHGTGPDRPCLECSRLYADPRPCGRPPTRLVGGSQAKHHNIRTH